MTLSTQVNAVRISDTDLVEASIQLRQNFVLDEEVACSGYPVLVLKLITLKP